MEVILLSDHTDKGVSYKKGDKLDVDTTTAQWLADNNVIAAPAVPKTPVASTTKES